MQKLVVAGLVSLALVGCNSGSGSGSSDSSGSETAKFNLAFSDAPVDGLEKVCVAFDQISVHHTDGSESSWGTSSFAVDQSSLECTPNHKREDIPGYEEGNPEFMVINLMAYQGNKSLQVLSDEQMATGKYTEMRLSVLEEKEADEHYYSDGTPYSHVVTDTKDTQGIRVPSGELKLDGFEVQVNATQAYTLEFDLRKSMVLNSNGYQLKPRGVRLVKNEDVATISGEVATESNACGGVLDNAFVYVYNAPTDGNYGDLGSDAEPYASVAVKGDRTFEIGYVPLGNYDIALVCNGSEDEPAPKSADTLVIDSVFENETLEASGLTFTF